MSEGGAPDTPPRRRLLVALDAAEDAQRLLDAAAEMAQRMNAELAGLFVEDADLIGLGDNPLVRTVSAFSRASGGIRRGTIEQALRRQVAAARAAFEQATRNSRFGTSFEVRRGRLASTIEAIADATDIIVVRRGASNVEHVASSRRARVSAATHRVVMAARRSVIVLDVQSGAPERAFGRVIVFYDGSGETESALIAAADIADRRGNDGISVVPIAANDAEAEGLARRAVEILARYGRRPEIAPYVAPDIDALCPVCAARRSGLLVLHAGHKLLQGEAMARLLDNVDCSVMVVR